MVDHNGSIKLIDFGCAKTCQVWKFRHTFIAEYITGGVVGIFLIGIARFPCLNELDFRHYVIGIIT